MVNDELVNLKVPYTSQVHFEEWIVASPSLVVYWSLPDIAPITGRSVSFLFTDDGKWRFQIWVDLWQDDWDAQERRGKTIRKKDYLVDPVVRGLGSLLASKTFKLDFSELMRTAATEELTEPCGVTALVGEMGVDRRLVVGEAEVQLLDELMDKAAGLDELQELLLKLRHMLE